MRVAITGEKGFLGHHLTKYYTHRGYEVVELGRDYLNNIHLVAKCDFLIHAAGVNRDLTEQDVYDKNVELAFRLIEKLNHYNIKVNIKFISSIQETNNNMYGRAKVKAKAILAEYCSTTNMLFETYALPNLFGTHGKPNYNSFINTFAYNIVNNIDCNYNDTQIHICWVYDAIEVIDNMLSEYKLYKTTPSEVYYFLLGIYKKTIDFTHSSLTEKLEQILNYYKT